MASPYITYRDKDEEGNLKYYILQRDFPHYLGVIVTIPMEGAISNEAIPGYNMWVSFAGVLRGNYIPDYRNTMDEINSVFSNMAAWFWAERIQENPKKYEKFKIQK
jgi:hypothetical protein